jgi:hypothetical protein
MSTTSRLASYPDPSGRLGQAISCGGQGLAGFSQISFRCASSSSAVQARNSTSFQFGHSSGKGKTTLSASMDTSQTLSKTRNTRGQGNDSSGRRSHSPSRDIPLHSGRPSVVGSVDDDFFDLVKSEVKVVTLADIKAYLKMYCLPSV